MVDTQIFRDAYKVIEGLKNHDCSEALTWCADNRGKLKKIKSKLEFKLHLQVFIEHVRANEMMQAIKYAKLYLSPWASQYMEELQRTIAAIAFQYVLLKFSRLNVVCTEHIRTVKDIRSCFSQRDGTSSSKSSTMHCTD